MKCIKLANPHPSEPEIIRISNKEAQDLVEAGEGKYTNKSAWKREGRHYG